MSTQPLCFVLMPFGTKNDPHSGLAIDFDEVYEKGVRPGIEDAGLDPIRADEERTGGIIHKPMFERLLLCDFAVADLTTANANVFYELGVRHATRPATTVSIFAEGQSVPFDLALVRAMPYSLGEGFHFGNEDAATLRKAIAARLTDLKSLQTEDAVTDSPVFQLLTDYSAPYIAHLKTDVFRDRTRYAADIKNQLAQARSENDKDALQKIEASMRTIADAEVGVTIDLYLSYRAVSEWQKMVDLHDRMPVVLKNTILVREQLGFALNRLGKRDQALHVLEGVIKEQGPNSETCGLIGRIYKDLWQEAGQAGQQVKATGYLKRAIDVYRQGFETDMRDAYPGVNAVTLLDIKGDSESASLVPIVRYAVERRIAAKQPDYWDYATLLELCVIGNDIEGAGENLATVLTHVREKWESETTANNLKMIAKSRNERGENTSWIEEIVETLTATPPPSVP